MRVVCPACGRENDEDATRCARCSAVLSTDDTARMPAAGAGAAAVASAPRHIGRYRLLSEIGRGGMGVVYEALDSRLQRRVALKVLSAGAAGDADSRERFEREARAASALDHPAVAGVLEIGDHGGDPYLVMPLYRGETLADRIARAPLAAAELLPLLDDLLGGLAAAHAASIVHRDIKPANLFVTEGGSLKILDFGLAKDVSAVGVGGPETAQGMLLGTLHYMAPEQCRGLDIDARTDLWAVGVVIYQALTGRLPFQGRTSADTLAAILSRRPAPLGEGVPGALAAVVMRLLEKSAEDRYASAVEVAAAVHAAADGRGAPTPGDSTVAVPEHDDDAPPSPSGSSLDPAPSARAVTPASAGLVQITAPPPTDGGATRSAPPPAAPRRRRWMGAAVAALAAAAALAVGARWQPSPAPEAPSDVPAPAPRVVACPPLAVEGASTDPGWLGATAAHLACERIGILLGARPERTVLPAELLSLPRTPARDFPEDPYVGADVRAKAVAVARDRASAWIDGSLRRHHRGFAVELQLVDARGAAGNKASADRPVLAAAIAAAIAGLDQAALGAVGDVDAELVDILGTRTVAATLLALDLLGGGPEERETRCRELTARRVDVVHGWAEVDAACNPGAPTAEPQLDRSSPGALGASSLAWVSAHPGDAAPLAAELSTMADREARPFTAAWLRFFAGRLFFAAADHERARAALLASVRTHPRTPAWSYLAVAFGGSDASDGFFQAAAAWAPAYLGYAFNVDMSRERRLRYVRRAYELDGSGSSYGASVLMRLLVADGRRDEALALMSSYPQRIEARPEVREHLGVLFERGAGRFGAAWHREQKLVLGATSGTLDPMDVVIELVVLADTLGKARPLANAWIDRFLLPEPPLLGLDLPWEIPTMGMCLRASAPKARQCMSRLAALRPRGAAWDDSSIALHAGATRYLAGDRKGAVDAWRPLLAAGPWWKRMLRVDAFDEVGELDLADRIDADLLEDTSFNGVSAALPRAAKRALARGDGPLAKDRARQVVDAWQDADVAVPAVVEMLTMLR
jgi:serine/threonine protein kinase